VTPAWPWGVVNVESSDSSFDISLPPQLIDTATTPGRALATFTAAVRSRIDALFASTRTMLAWGAIACAHSTSSAISEAQLAFGGGVVPPVALIENVGSPATVAPSIWGSP
jgi:hypothetical protein